MLIFGVFGWWVCGDSVVLWACSRVKLISWIRGFLSNVLETLEWRVFLLLCPGAVFMAGEELTVLVWLNRNNASILSRLDIEVLDFLMMDFHLVMKCNHVLISFMWHLLGALWSWICSGEPPDVERILDVKWILIASTSWQRVLVPLDTDAISVAWSNCVHSSNNFPAVCFDLSCTANMFTMNLSARTSGCLASVNIARIYIQKLSADSTCASFIYRTAFSYNSVDWSIEE